MPKSKKMGRPKSGRMTITVRLSPQEKSSLEDAAEAAGLDKSAYMRKALTTQLKKDGHLKRHTAQSAQ